MDIIATIKIKKKTTHGYIILEFEIFLRERDLTNKRVSSQYTVVPKLIPPIMVGCISGISLLLPGYYYKWIWHRMPESDT